jgi:hypothetical protein
MGKGERFLRRMAALRASPHRFGRDLSWSPTSSVPLHVITGLVPVISLL